MASGARITVSDDRTCLSRTRLNGKGIGMGDRIREHRDQISRAEQYGLRSFSKQKKKNSPDVDCIKFETDRTDRVGKITEKRITEIIFPVARCSP